MLRAGRVLFLLGGLALLAACADDGDGDGGDTGSAPTSPSDEQAYADAFAASLVDDENGFGVEPDEAECMGEAVMTELGVEPFEEAGVDARRRPGRR